MALRVAAARPEGMRIEVRHRLPCRVRVTAPELRGRASSLRRLCGWLETRPAIRRVACSAAIGSITVELAPPGGAVPQADVLRALREVDPRELAHRAAPGPPRARPASHSQSTSLEAAPRIPRHFIAASAGVLASFAGGPLAVAGAAATLYAAWPTCAHAVEVVRREHRLNVDVQDGLAVGLSLVRRRPVTAALIVWLLRLGDLIRDLTAARSRGAIDELLDFQKQTCWALVGEKKLRRSVKRLQAGDVIAIDAGSVLPVDGVVISGVATVDQSAVTGESLPITAARGRAVYAGTSLQEGHLHVRATAVGPQTTVARIVRMVKDTPVGETRAQNYAERLADRLVTPMLAAGLGLAALTGDVERLVSMLIVDYGTGIRIAAPTAILSTITRAARRGVLIKSGGAMEKLAHVDAMLFDKTGTLTRGAPRVLEVLSYLPRLLPQRLLSWVAAAEARQHHPVAHAVLERARREHLTVPARDSGRSRIGRGVEAQVSGHEVWVGSGRFLTEKGVPLRRARADLRRCAADGCSALLVAVDGELAGALPYADEIRPEMHSVLDRLHARGIRELTMITGDDAGAARSVARRLGFDDFEAEVSPEDKAVRRALARRRPHRRDGRRWHQRRRRPRQSRCRNSRQERH